MSRGRDVLMYVEDPGAARYLGELPGALRARGRTVLVVTGGAASEFMRDPGPDQLAYADDHGDAGEVLREVRPRVVVVGTAEDPETPGLALIAAARALGVPTVGAVDGPTNAEHRFRGASDRPLAFVPDVIVVPDDATAARFVALGAAPSRVVACGHPGYDAVARRLALLEETGRSELRARRWPRSADRALVVFVAELSSGPGEGEYSLGPGYRLRGRGSSTGRTEIVLEELLDAVGPFRGRLYLVLRLHPKNDPAAFAPYRDAFDEVSDGGDPLVLLYAADAVVGMTSAALTEAAIVGTPTLSIVPREVEKGWLPTIGLGVMPCATTREEVRREVRRLIDRAATGDRRPWAAPHGALERIAGVVEAALSSVR